MRTNYREVWIWLMVRIDGEIVITNVSEEGFNTKLEAKQNLIDGVNKALGTSYEEVEEIVAHFDPVACIINFNPIGVCDVD